MARTVTMLKQAFGTIYVCNNCNPYHLVVPDWHEWKEVKANGSSRRLTDGRAGTNAVRKAKSKGGKGQGERLFE